MTDLVGSRRSPFNPFTAVVVGLMTTLVVTIAVVTTIGSMGLFEPAAVALLVLGIPCIIFGVYLTFVGGSIMYSRRSSSD